MMQRMVKLMDEYLNVFGESFPSYQFMHLEMSEICKIIEDCLKRGKNAYQAKYLTDEEGVVY